MRIQIDVTSDFICPWCHIGEKRLARAIGTLPPGIEVQVTWKPFELNAAMPPEGMDRKAYRAGKFGSWERSQAMDAQTEHAGRADDVHFDYEAMRRTPNTFLAHRVSWLAAREGRQAAFVAAALRGYFAEGRDIGDKQALVEIAGEVGLDRDKVAAFLETDEGAAEVRALEQQAQAQGINGVPRIDIAGEAIFGAQHFGAIRRAIIQAADRMAAA